MTQKADRGRPSDVLIIGGGYLGKTVGHLISGTGANVYATSRSPHRLREFATLGWHPVPFDWTKPSQYGNLRLGQLSAAPRVLVAVSYDRKSRVSRYESQVGGFRNLLQILPQDARICYISTTGVYHQRGGEWVDETSPTRPDRVGGRVHLQAESLLHAVRPESSWNVLRLAGIYGPGRVPRAADVIAGRPIASPEDGFLNLIHVHDAARAVLASWDHMPVSAASLAVGMQHRLYVVADDQPVLRGHFYQEIARQTGAPPPQFVAPSPDAPVLMRSNSNKRIWNRKLHRDLLRTLRFPNYRCGLADVLAPNVN